VGSSSRSTRLSCASARARCARWSSPPESVRTSRSARLATSARLIASSMRARSCAACAVPRCAKRPSSTRSRTVIGTSTCVSWSTSVARRATSTRESERTFVPPRSTSPPVIASRPSSARSSVDLPLPLAPTTATRACVASEIETPSSTRRCPRDTRISFASRRISLMRGSARARSRTAQAHRAAP
jgi:hypothetical protein